MPKIEQNQQIILNIFLRKGSLSSSEVYQELSRLGSAISLVTVKRELAELKDLLLLDMSGAGRSVTYSISGLGRLFTNVNAAEYSATEPDKRVGLKGIPIRFLIPKNCW